ncbi:MAG: hypothetical protein OEM03_11555 [Chromatiales bacterium]|nr:hypothetical protein [Chromatiales bacterium]
MQPIAIITGIFLGSSAAIASGLAVVLFIYWLLLDEYPRLEAEMPVLLESSGIFLVMTVVCAVSFIGVIKMRPWRWAAQAVMWASFLGVAYYYWP